MSSLDLRQLCRPRNLRVFRPGLLWILLAVSCAGTLAGSLTVDGKRALAHVETLTSFGPHPAGSSAQFKVVDYITDQLKGLGLSVAQDRFTASTPLGEKTMTNVWATIPGETDDVIIIASHTDSKFYPQFEFVGANDGGSSTGLLLELARVLNGENPTSHTLWLVFFDGEEAFLEWTDADSLYGSRRFVEQMQLTGELKKVGAMVLLDLVGGKELVLDVDMNSTSWLIQLIWDKAHELGYGSSFPRYRKTGVTDDHIPFRQRGIPVVDLIDLTNYPFWHRQGDTLDKLAPESLEIVGNVVLASLPGISEHLKGQ